MACFGGVKLAILLDKLAVWYRTLYCSYLMHLYVSIHMFLLLWLGGRIFGVYDRRTDMDDTLCIKPTRLMKCNYSYIFSPFFSKGSFFSPALLPKPRTA